MVGVGDGCVAVGVGGTGVKVAVGGTGCRGVGVSVKVSRGINKLSAVLSAPGPFRLAGRRPQLTRLNTSRQNPNPFRLRRIISPGQSSS